MRSDGSQKQILKEYAREPNWSPDGERILFIKYIGQGNPEIFTMNTLGLEDTQITNLHSPINFPRYSRDGSKIVFVNGDSIWIMNSNGSGSYFLIKGNYPSWSFDGNKIVFARYDSDNHLNNGVLWVINNDGTGLNQITSGLI